jgi:hypothetical protein
MRREENEEEEEEEEKEEEKKERESARERKREAVGRVRGLGHSPRPETSMGPPGTPWISSNFSGHIAFEKKKKNPNPNPTWPWALNNKQH